MIESSYVRIGLFQHRSGSGRTILKGKKRYCLQVESTVFVENMGRKIHDTM